MPEVRIGTYVEYNKNPYIVVDWTDHRVKILNVLNNRKHRVYWTSIKVLPWQCKIVEIGSLEYLVTLKDKLIVSLENRRVLKDLPVKVEEKILDLANK